MQLLLHALLLVCVHTLTVPAFEMGTVLEITAANFHKYLQDYEKPLDYFVMFYAPWCGHCQRLMPMWDQMAGVFNKPGLHPHIAKIDCTEETQLCSEQSVKGYPTLLYYRYQKPGVGHRYSGTRTLDQFTAFITEKQQPIQKAEVIDIMEGLLQLTDENFHTFASQGDVFIKFFAPWCGHCKTMAPAWMDLARAYQHHKALRIAEIDCTVNKRICSEHNVEGYPTLLYIRDGRLVDKYTGLRDFESLDKFVETQLKQRVLASVQEQGNLERDDKHLAEKVSVVKLRAENFDLTLQNYRWVFVKFFAPWCGHCKQMAPAWLELGEKMSSRNLLIAEVDCTEEPQICEKQNVAGYPTLRLFFQNGHTDYEGERTRNHLQIFLSSREVKDEL